MDRVVDALREHKFEIVSTNLSKEDEVRLRAVFEEEGEERAGQGETSAA